MGRFAEQTTVTVERSRAEVENTLARYGADAFVSGWEGQRAFLMFRVDGRHIRMELEMPTTQEYVLTEKGRRRTQLQAEKERDQAARQRWRALNLVVKAKLEAVESGISTVEDEFLAFTVLPDGTRVRDHVGPALEETYRTGTMPALMPGPSA